MTGDHVLHAYKRFKLIRYSLNLSGLPADFNDMLLSAMLDVRAWALARPISEQDATGDALAVRMGQVRKTEEEQGRSPFFGRHILRSELLAVTRPCPLCVPLLLWFHHAWSLTNPIILVCTQNKLVCGSYTSLILSSLRWQLLRRVYNLHHLTRLCCSLFIIFGTVYRIVCHAYSMSLHCRDK